MEPSGSASGAVLYNLQMAVLLSQRIGPHFCTMGSGKASSIFKQGKTVHEQDLNTHLRLWFQAAQDGSTRIRDNLALDLNRGEEVELVIFI